MKVVSIERVPNHLSDVVITVERHKRRWWWQKPQLKQIRYRGSSTVWHDEETGDRPGTRMEVWLAARYEKWTWRKPK